MHNSYNIQDLFAVAFNYRALPFPAGIPNIAVDLKDKFSSLGSALTGKSALGTPYFMPVKLSGVELSIPLVTISARKRIVQTPLVGRRGTVKELINIEDYAINIKGIAIEQDSRFPEFSIQQMRDLFEINQAITIQCALTDIFLQQDDSVVITGMSFPDMRGIEHAQAYEINLVSDQDFELIIE